EKIFIAQQKNSTPILPKPLSDSYTNESAKLTISNNTYTLTDPNGNKSETNLEQSDLSRMPPLFLEEGSILHAKIVDTSISEANDASALQFTVKFRLQDNILEGIIPYDRLQIVKATVQTLYPEPPETNPFWTYSISSKQAPAQLVLPAIA